MNTTKHNLSRSLNTNPMDIQQLFNIQSTQYIDRKVFQYPFLFDVQVNPEDGSIIHLETTDAITSWNSDLILECLEPLSCEIFCDAFQYKVSDEPPQTQYEFIESSDTPRQYAQPEEKYDTITDYVEYTEPFHSYVSLPSLDELIWSPNLAKIDTFITELNKLFKAEYVVAGKSFADAVLKFGTLGNYYLQYLANGIFGHPNAVMAIHNRRQIISQFELMSEQLGQHLSSQDMYERIADIFYLAITEMAPERWHDISTNQIQFRRGDILECMVQIGGHVRSSIPIPNTYQGKAIQATLTQLFTQSSICDEHGVLYPRRWKLRFVLL